MGHRVLDTGAVPPRLLVVKSCVINERMDEVREMPAPTPAWPQMHVDAGDEKLPQDEELADDLSVLEQIAEDAAPPASRETTGDGVPATRRAKDLLPSRPLPLEQEIHVQQTNPKKFGTKSFDRSAPQGKEPA